MTCPLCQQNVTPIEGVKIYRNYVVTSKGADKLGPIQIRTLDVLLRHPAGLNRRDLTDKVYSGLRQPTDPEQVIAQTVSILRQRLVPLGLTVLNTTHKPHNPFLEAANYRLRWIHELEAA